eukprot:UN23868
MADVPDVPFYFNANLDCNFRFFAYLILGAL